MSFKISSRLFNYSIRFIIGIIIVLILLSIFGLSEFYYIIENTNVAFIALAVVSHLIALCVAVFRIYFLLDKKISFYQLFKANMFSMLLGDLTPGRAGYFVLPVLIQAKKPNIERSEVISILFFGQSFDFILRGFLLVITIGYFIFLQSYQGNLLTFLILTLILIIILSLVFYLMAFNMIPDWATNLILEIPFVGKIFHGYSSYVKTASYHKNKSLITLGITILGWLTTSLRWICVGYSIYLIIPLEWYLFMFPSITITSFIPISAAGIGIVETGFVLIFSLLGYPAIIAISFSLIDRSVSIFSQLLSLPYGLKTLKLSKTEN